MDTGAYSQGARAIDFYRGPSAFHSFHLCEPLRTNGGQVCAFHLNNGSGHNHACVDIGSNNSGTQTCVIGVSPEDVLGWQYFLCNSRAGGAGGDLEDDSAADGFL